MFVASMGTVRMSQMWMLRWVVLLVGLQSIQADFMEDYGVTEDPVDFTTTEAWPTTTAVYPSNHVNNICSMWGNFHFKTFDGDVYQFPGTCEYNLVSDCQNLIRQFSVNVKRTGLDNDPKISSVSINIDVITIHLTENQVVVNGENKTLPVYIGGILLEENTDYTRVHSKTGITVMWNKKDAVMVELDSKYSDQTCGLCGDFNGVPDEFIESGSGFERTVGFIEFGNKHSVYIPNDNCQNPSEEDDEKNLLNKCDNYKADCADLLEDEDWFSCNKILNPEPYISACILDMCMYEPEDTVNSSLCSTLSEYSRQCSHAGGNPPNWRTHDFCAVTCPYNMVHSESGSPCLDTCSHKVTLCEEHKIDGCFCPPGTVFDDITHNGCIPVEKCQCTHNNINYEPGKGFYNMEEECICEEGKWICESIPGPGLCAVEEGSHFTTYDGKEFTFHGECIYVLSKDCNETKFIILVQIYPCGTLVGTCLKSIEVLFHNDKNNRLVINYDGTVQHNAKVLLPYMAADFTVFKPSSFHIMLQTSFGLQVQVQLVPLMQVYITVNQSFQGKTCGLCGNFNKVLSDDLKTPQGLVEGTADSFANAWKAQSNCPDHEERIEDPCSYSSEIEQFAEHWCSMMKDKESLFAKCHTTVNPDSYYKRCKYSSCSCKRSEDCLCAVFSSYARACAVKGIFLQGWREIVCEKYTENCPKSQNYSYRLQSCQRTCLSLASKRQICSVDFVPVDGCACPDGFYQDKKGLCVPIEKCPCDYKGETVQPGTSININNEHCVCVNGTLHCQSWKNQILECLTPKVFFNCSTARKDEHGLACAQTCMQQEVDCFSQECESGCQCPKGLLDDGKGKCVKPHECPCPHDGDFHKPGEKITVDCNKCTCQGGKWICTKNKCPGVCTIYGSGHYKTFDQQRFGFRGDCSYIAAQDKCGNKTGNFHVITENIPCGTTGTTCSKAVVIILGETVLELSDGTVKVSNTTSGPKINYIERKIGMYLVIDTDIGLTVLWDRKTTIHIILQPQHMENVCGLCGNFNGNGKDDFTTQGSLQTTNLIEFVDSWKVSSRCPDSAPDFDPCFETPHRVAWARKECIIIMEDKFINCSKKVDPNPYYENCVKDSCACDTGGDCECLCTAVAAYAQACNDAGVNVDWRTPEFCPVYCDYYNKKVEDEEECIWHYRPFTPWYKTCSHKVINNTLPNVEGCFPKCPKDYPFFDEKQQICVKDCFGPPPPPPPHTSTPTTTSTTPITPRPPVSTEVPSTTSTTPGTPPPSTPTSTSTTPITPLPPVSTEVPSTTSTTPGTPPPSTPTSTSTTPITPLPPVSTQVPSTTSTTPGTPPPSTPTSTSTTPITSPVSTEVPSTTSTSKPTTTSTTTPLVISTESTTRTPITTQKQIVYTSTPCFCVFQGIQYKPGESILHKTDNGSGICLTMNCSNTCAIQNFTEPCPTPPPIACPKWNKTANEIFHICDCIMGKCINGDIMEIVQHQCPFPKSITCKNNQTAVLVYDELHCCRQYTCDCFCQGWGGSHYLTFDGLPYTYQGNCTYILMEEISPKYNLKIYIDNVYCDIHESVSCPRSIIVSYNNQVITLRNHRFMEGAALQALKDNVNLTLPYTQNGVRVIKSSLNLILEVPELQVVVTFGNTDFSINLPFQHFGKNTQGHCGTCNNNQDDDCMLPGGTLVNDCAVMADHWTASGVDGKNCTKPSPRPPVQNISTPKPITPYQPHVDCHHLKSEVFEACHSHVSPENFFLACQYDSIHMSDPSVVCASLQSYARACSLVGVCIHWRNYTSLCNIKCPEDKIFLPCGPAEPPTCRGGPMQSSISVPTEGCFCRENKTLFSTESGLCVSKCGCVDSSGTPREFDKHFMHNCEDCVCDKASQSVICKPKKCPDVTPENCTGPGFMLFNETDPADPCCSKQVCKEIDCAVNMCNDGSCTKESCTYVASDNTTHTIKDGGEYKYKCETVTCNQINGLFVTEKTITKCPYLSSHDCKPGFEYVKKEEECCGTCTQVACIYEAPDNTRQTLKDGEVHKYKCENVTCREFNGVFVTEKTIRECPYLSSHNCGPGFEYMKKESECCETCTQVACIYDAPDNTRHVLTNGEEVKYKCETVTCHQIKDLFETKKTNTECAYLSSQDCGAGFEYVKKEGECCGTCTQIACIYDAPDNTRQTLKFGEIKSYTCETVTCHQINDSFISEKTKKECAYLSSQDCGPGFEYVKKEGECCGSCTQVACIYDAPNKTRQTLKDGEVKSYTCETVTCREFNGLFVTEKTKTKCPYSSSLDCGPGFEYVKKEGECCGTCTQVACIYDAPDDTRHVLNDGKEYYFKCMNTTCVNRNGMFMTKESYKQCPPFNPDDCKPETVQYDKDGCCKICELSNCVRAKNVTRLYVNDCTSIEDVEVTSCAGHCDDGSMYSMENDIMMHSCSCCREERVSRKDVMLKCANGSEILHHYTYIETCKCTPTECEETGKK